MNFVINRIELLKYEVKVIQFIQMDQNLCKGRNMFEQ